MVGIRDSKTVGSTVYSYLTQNGKVVQQSWNGNVMDFIYDENGRPYACIYKDALYYYVLNLQGDVIGLVNTSGAYVAKYTYDAWGRLLSGTGTMASTNPLRYRGYYYDNDTKLYYLGSRYYDPAVKRFINADGYVSTGQGFVGYNMFAYCNNSPVNYVDIQGALAAAITVTATNFWNPIGWIAAATVVIEGAIITGCIIAVTREALRQAYDTPAQTSPASPNYASKSSNQQKTQTKSVSSSTSASPKPPNNNRPSLKKIANNLLKKLGLDAHSIKYEYLGKKAPVSRYDLAYDTRSGIIYIIKKTGEIVMETHYNIHSTAR